MVTKKEKKMKTLKISEDLHTFLEGKGKKGETFEDIIWRLSKKK